MKAADGCTMATSDLEAAFDTLWRQIGGPDLVAEHRFAPPQRWRFDRAHPYARVAIEIDGGTWGVKDKRTGEVRPGRHVSGAGYTRDCVKLNEAASRGWLIFRLTSDMLRDDPYNHLQPIADKITDLMDEEA